MKRIFALVLVMLLLCGCGKSPQEEPTTAPTTEVPTTEPTVPSATEPVVQEHGFGVYDPDSAIETATGGAVKRYSLEEGEYYAVTPMAEGLLLFSGDDYTKLTYLRQGVDPVTATLDGVLIFPMVGSCYVSDEGVAYLDEGTNALVFLNTELQETGRAQLPEERVSDPVLSEDWKLVYYFDDTYLRSLNLETGICRLLSDSWGTQQEMMGLFFDDSVLGYRSFDWDYDAQYLLVSVYDGEVLYHGENLPTLQTHGDWYYAETVDGPTVERMFGLRGEEVFCLVPDGDYARSFPVAQQQAVVLCDYMETGFSMDYFTLSDGLRSSAVVMEGIVYQTHAQLLEDGFIWILGMENGESYLYGWELALTPTGDTESYIDRRYTQQDPDVDGLAEIAKKARQLGDSYGVRVLVYQEAANKQPVDFTFEAEYRVAVYEYYLPILEKALGAYPEGFLKRLGTGSGNGKVTISLVGAAKGDTDLGAVNEADGVQFWDNGNTYVTLVMNGLFEQSLYHELYHCIDTFVISRTQAFDFWDGLNPEGFQYDNSYQNYDAWQDSPYVQDEDRYFIDAYSTSYAKEDRARIIEYAMQEGYDSYFQSEAMQGKLEAICNGIRVAFGLKKYQEVLCWEQYLHEQLMSK